MLDELKQSVSSRSTFSRLSFLVRLLYIKSHYRVSNNYFDALLVLLSDAFPRSNVPKSCEEACKYIRELGVDYCWATPLIFRTPCKQKGESLSDWCLSHPLEGERERSVDKRAFAQHKSKVAEMRLLPNQAKA